jgi:NADPH-dependent 2,4-dienoyl-CoA reductase/sulfur reductase-like enzyme
MAAAVCARRSGARVVVVDANPLPGGQIWRGASAKSALAKRWLTAFEQAACTYLPNTGIVYRSGDQELVAEADDGTRIIRYQKVIIATGARELFIPFPGWTLPGVTGVGGLQALVKGGLPIRGKRVVIAGSGPLLLATADFLREQGAQVVEIVEQAPFARVARFGAGLVGFPSKTGQLAQLQWRLRGIPYRIGAWVTSAEQADRRGIHVTVQQGDRLWTAACDYLASSFHLIPNLEVPLVLGCTTADGQVVVNTLQESTRPGVYCAGESTGIGGVELALSEGQIAGYAATGQNVKAESLIHERDHLNRFADRLNRTFAPREALKTLALAETLVCRCEDVTLGEVRKCGSWREAKLYTRCGMGPCQGRVCGAALHFMLGWPVESGRPPIFPTRLASLAASDRLAVNPIPDR